MGKNITLKQLNKSSTYDELYPAGAIDYTMLTETTSAAYGVENGSVKDALTGLYQYIHSSDVVKIKVVDASNNPLPNITANGITGSPQSGTDGVIKGVVNSNSVTLVSPYVDTIKTKTVDVSKYKNTTRTLIVTMDSVADGAIVRYTSSQNVMFSNRVANIDVCCVGAGGGGGAYFTQNSAYHNGGGGGGGAIVNSYGITLIANTPYPILIGTGGSTGQTAGAGGTTSFMSVSAPGGGGAYMSSATGLTGGGRGGAAGLTGCGDGGSERETIDGGSNTTISEFDDGKTFYSGGGGAGVLGQGSQASGGSPNGADGGYIHVTGAYDATVSNAPIPGIGGGGGGGAYWHSGAMVANPSVGGSGLVAIRIHTS